jgi:hypothetical protein
MNPEWGCGSKRKWAAFVGMWGRSMFRVLALARAKGRYNVRNEGRWYCTIRTQPIHARRRDTRPLAFFRTYDRIGVVSRSSLFILKHNLSRLREYIHKEKSHTKKRKPDVPFGCQVRFVLYVYDCVLY